MGGTTTEPRFIIVCWACERRVLARRAWVGRSVACPHCDSAMRVPEPPADGQPVRAVSPGLTGRRYFNFPCPRCDALLEGNTGLSHRESRCPACGVTLVVPTLHPVTQRPLAAVACDAPDDTRPVTHAYAGSGAAAPEIARGPDGTAWIVCPGCRARNEIDADQCRDCGQPFTVEGAATGSDPYARNLAGAAVAIGAVSWPLFVLAVPAAGAIALGIAALLNPSGYRYRGRALTGIALGVVSLAGFSVYMLMA